MLQHAQNLHDGNVPRRRRRETAYPIGLPVVAQRITLLGHVGRQVFKTDRTRTLGMILHPMNQVFCNGPRMQRSEEHTSELQSRPHLVCRLLLEKKKKKK